MLHEVRKRACANCCAFEDQLCMNLVTFSEAAGLRSPLPGDVCTEHMTEDENQLETSLIEEGREGDGIAGAHAAVQAWRAGRRLMATLTKRKNGGVA